MTDEEFVKKLQALDAAGKDGIPAMREVLRGNMTRLITLAVRGVGVAEIKVRRSRDMSLIDDDFPDAAAKASAIEYWNSKHRPDLVARVEEIAEQFHTHHYIRNNRFNGWDRVWKTWYVRSVTVERPPRADGGLFQAARLAFEQTNEAGWLGRVRGFYEGGFWGDTWGAQPPAKPLDALPQGCMCPAGVLRKYAEQRRSA